jgi:hypothetical protein
MPWGAAAAAAAAVAGAGMDAKSQKDAAKAQSDQLQANEAFIKEQAEKSREDALPLFASAEQNRNLGFQAALDAFAQTVPQQFSAFQQGNVGAQNALLAGLPQFQNAILGGQVDLSALQPQAIQYDTSFAQQQLPQFVGGASGILEEEEAKAALADANAKYSPETIQAILNSGLFPKLTNQVTRALGDVNQIRPGEFQQLLADRPRLGSFFQGEAMNIAQRKGILPQQTNSPLSGNTY